VPGKTVFRGRYCQVLGEVQVLMLLNLISFSLLLCKIKLESFSDTPITLIKVEAQLSGANGDLFYDKVSSQYSKNRFTFI
jgi:hypothetical protein